MTSVVPIEKLTRKDFATDQDVRWCPGCGDYAILATVQRTMPELGVPPERMVWVSGIGCSSRFPYYMNTYGFHTIHGRAPAFATGIKVANPELDVWLVTGDGDGLSIGGNHLMHLLRRNVGVNVLMFNNRIYGLTKGQYSPTSEVGKVTKSTPMGSADNPLEPVSFALGCNAGFVARTIDVEAKHLAGVLTRAAHHEGTAFVEIYQNCNVFNDGAFDGFREKVNKPEHQLLLEHGKPMFFGMNDSKGLAFDLRTFALEVVDCTSEQGRARVLVHDESNATLASLLAKMPFPSFPVALGVLYAGPQAPTYEARLATQYDSALTRAGAPDLDKLLNSGDTWTVS